MGIQDSMPRGADDVVRRLAALEAANNVLLGLVGSAKALAQAIQTGLGNLAASGTTWAGPVASPSTVSATGAVSGASLAVTGGATVGGDINLTGDLYSVHGLNTPVTDAYFAAYFNSDGRLGRSASARRYKQEIAACTPNNQAVFALQLVTYRLREAVAELGDNAPVEHGLIAEELVALGLEWLVTYIGGVVEGIAYEKLALALLPVVQDHEKRLLALEARP